MHDRSFHQGQRDTVRVVDRSGGSDSFAEGRSLGSLSGRDLEATSRGIVAASALKQGMSGDVNVVSVVEVERLMRVKPGRELQRQETGPQT